MEPAQKYRLKAANLRTMAAKETNPQITLEFERLARSYARLAKQADQNKENGAYETRPTDSQSDGAAPEC